MTPEKNREFAFPASAREMPGHHWCLHDLCVLVRTGLNQPEFLVAREKAAAKFKRSTGCDLFSHEPDLTDLLDIANMLGLESAKTVAKAMGVPLLASGGLIQTASLDWDWLVKRARAIRKAENKRKARK